jgi:hypothetical protein
MGGQKLFLYAADRQNLAAQGDFGRATRRSALIFVSALTMELQIVMPAVGRPSMAPSGTCTWISSV